MPELNRDTRELLGDFIRSRGWEFFFRAVLAPKLHTWIHELLYNPAISEGQRLGYQHALAAFKEGVESCYEQAGLTLPTWIREELALHERDD